MKLMVHTKTDCYIFEEVEQIDVYDESGLAAVQDPDINGWSIKEADKVREESENE